MNCLSLFDVPSLAKKPENLDQDGVQQIWTFKIRDMVVE